MLNNLYANVFAVEQIAISIDIMIRHSDSLYFIVLSCHRCILSRHDSSNKDRTLNQKPKDGVQHRQTT